MEIAFGEWISVEDRLPDDPSWVLVEANGAMNCMGFSKGEWQNWENAENIVIDDITHWMPLPERAKEKAQRDNVNNLDHNLCSSGDFFSEKIRK